MKNKTRDRFLFGKQTNQKQHTFPLYPFPFCSLFWQYFKKAIWPFLFSDHLKQKTYFLRFLIKLQNAYTILLNSIWHGLWNLSQSRKFQYSGSWKTFLSPSDTIKCRMTLYLINGWLMKDQLPAFMQITS
jgi:hypothetical protein